MKPIVTAILLTIVLTCILGIGYPLAVTGISKVLFPTQAEGSLVEYNGTVVGSSRIGQAFHSEKFFHGRPSAAGVGYDASASSGSNLAPTSKALIDRLQHDADSLRTQYLELRTTLPADMLTTSASGLDPDITIANAMLQVPIVAKANNLSAETVRQLVELHSHGRDLGILGEPHLNVLELNLAVLALTQKD